MVTHEPSDDEVEAIIEKYPGGCTLDVIAEALGVTRMRAKQICDHAIFKVLRHLRAQGIRRVNDVIDHRWHNHNHRDSLYG